jgi:hypothetical protein
VSALIIVPIALKRITSLGVPPRPRVPSAVIVRPGPTRRRSDAPSSRSAASPVLFTRWKNAPWCQREAQTRTNLEPRADLGVAFSGDTDTVSVSVRSDKVRDFGFSSWQRTTRTRGELTRCRKMVFARIRSGSSRC